jgi:hypothetical protein
MAKQIKKKKLKKIISKLVHYIELEDLAEFEETDTGTAEFHRGVARGMRTAVRLLSPKDEPDYAIIKRGELMSRYNFVPYDESGATQELTLEWVD